ncbi:MAG: tetratricopeptide repeat protein [Gammaproteobacteria bacterium]
MMPTESTVQRLKELLAAPDREVRVAEAALWVAKSEYPSLDVTAYLRRLDRWGAEVRSRLPVQPTAEQIVLTLNEFLFEELGCSAGLPLEGVSFPGHFLVKFSVLQGEVVLDPFSQGVSLEEADLEELLARAEVNLHAGRPSLTQLLVGADPRDILVRMLRNLKGIYLHQKNLHKTLHMMDLIVAVRPDTPFEYRDRGRVYQELECFGAALADYRHYLELSPRADDVEEVRGRVIELQRRKQVLH